MFPYLLIIAIITFRSSAAFLRRWLLPGNGVMKLFQEVWKLPSLHTWDLWHSSSSSTTMQLHLRHTRCPWKKRKKKSDSFWQWGLKDLLYQYCIKVFSKLQIMINANSRSKQYDNSFRLDKSKDATSQLIRCPLCAESAWPAWPHTIKFKNMKDTVTVKYEYSNIAGLKNWQTVNTKFDKIP